MSTEFKLELRSKREIKKMRVAGLVVWEAHQAAARIMEPGVTTAEINAIYQETFRRHDAQPLFLNYGGTDTRPPFPAETCISINQEVVHGIPGSRKLVAGDIVSVDTGCRIAGWCGDAAVTHAIGSITQAQQKLLDVTRQTLDLAIELVDKHHYWNQVGHEMQQLVESNGFSVVTSMVGHGIGRDLHEPPQVPNYLNTDEDFEDFEIRPGMVLAIEPMVNAGVPELVEHDDGWTVTTADDQPSAHFEHTVAITREGPIRLTGPPNDDELASMPSWLHDRDQWVLW